MYGGDLIENLTVTFTAKTSLGTVTFSDLTEIGSTMIYEQIVLRLLEWEQDVIKCASEHLLSQIIGSVEAEKIRVLVHSSLK